MKPRIRPSLTLITALFIILACSLPQAPTATPPPTTELIATVADTATSPPPTVTPIQHQLMPASLPAERSSHAGDHNSSITAYQKKSNGGDRFTFERFERPFNGATMDTYFPELDIIDTFVYQDDTWIYGTIQVVDRAAGKTPFRFAMQLDVNVDGKGDWLVIAHNPPTNPYATDWATEGVQVYFDADDDVGNTTPVQSDAGATSGNGFETLIFDGYGTAGDDPDSAWIRVSPQNGNTVELAVKRSLLGNVEEFLLNMWTGRSCLEPALFDLSDHYTHEQAGAADPEFPVYYPIKAVFELDSSCRMAVGFKIGRAHV